MRYQLISDDDYASLPADPEMKWLALEAKCMSTLNELVSENSNAVADDLLRLQYMNTVHAAAEALGIVDIDVPPDSVENFGYFLMNVTKVSTKLRLKTSTSRSAFSVEIGRPTKGRLLGEIDRLWRMIEQSDLDRETKQKLKEELAELEQIIVAPRSDFARIMAILGFVGMFVAGTTSTLADGPAAIATITAIIGEEKAEEERTTLMIDSVKSPLQLEDKRKNPSTDDEPPF